MGLFSRRKRDSAESAQESMEAAMRELDEVASIVASDPQASGSTKVVKQMAKVTKRYRPLFEEGGLLRDRFVDVALGVLLPGYSLGDLPSMVRVPWAVGDFAGLLRAAEEASAEIIWVSHPDPQRDGDPFAELDARAQFKKDEALAVVFVGDVPPFAIRRDFILLVAPELEPDYRMEDLPQDFMDAAERHGLKCFQL
jgi:hypothetical protein